MHEVTLTEGFWEGTLEPSASIRVSDGITQVRALAEHAQGAWEQDAVISFRESGGGKDLAAQIPGKPAQLVKALTAAGVQGATVYGDRAEIMGEADVVHGLVEKVLAETGTTEFTFQRGDFDVVS